jgi:hypothetical protein
LRHTPQAPPSLRGNRIPLRSGVRCLGFAAPTPAPNHLVYLYFVSLCGVCFRQKRQNLLSSSRSVVFFLFFVVW